MLVGWKRAVYFVSFHFISNSEELRNESEI